MEGVMDFGLIYKVDFISGIQDGAKSFTNHFVVLRMYEFATREEEEAKVREIIGSLMGDRWYEIRSVKLMSHAILSSTETKNENVCEMV